MHVGVNADVMVIKIQSLRMLKPTKQSYASSPLLNFPPIVHRHHKSFKMSIKREQPYKDMKL